MNRLKCLRNVSVTIGISFRLTWDYRNSKLASRQDCYWSVLRRWMRRIISFVWKWQIGFIQIVSVVQKQKITVCVCWKSCFISLDLYTGALRFYASAIPHENSFQLSFVTGALKALRSLGHKERLHQLILR